jgi:hypothetical protein
MMNNSEIEKLIMEQQYEDEQKARELSSAQVLPNPLLCFVAVSF